MDYRDHQRARYGHGPTPQSDPYSTNPVYPTYDQSGTGYDNYPGQYSDNANPQAPQRQATMRSFLADDNPRTRPDFSDAPRGKAESFTSGFDNGEFVSEKKPRNFKAYRSSHRENSWTRGSRAGCIGRFCCCTIVLTAFFFISIVLALALFIRPPAVSILGVTPMGTPDQSNAVAVDLGVGIVVNNPNYFDVNFKKIKAEIFYPINNTAIGGGESNNIVFKSNEKTNWTFPFRIEYDSAKDPRGLVLADLVSKCGASKGTLVVNYKISLAISILFVTINPVVEDKFSFTCPIDLANIDINSLSSITG